MEEIVQGLIDRTRARLNVKLLKTIFGAEGRPNWRQNRKRPRLEVVVERPQYDLTIFKLYFGKLTLKVYTKGGRVLRIEVVLHNAKGLSADPSQKHEMLEAILPPSETRPLPTRRQAHRFIQRQIVMYRTITPRGLSP